MLLAVGLILVVLAYFVDHTRSAFNNLILLMFLTSIGVGSLFLVAMEYLGGAVWSTPFRRITEFFAAVILVIPLAAIPIYFNLHDLFHWTHAEAVAEDKILAGKSSYLNETFFIIRIVFFIAVWFLFYFLIIKNSKKQDSSGDPKLTTRNIKLSAVFIPIFGLTITFASIDWVMSLEPHWFSTIFGVYFFSGTILAALAFTTFIVVYMNEKGLLIKGIKKDHYYSLGAYLFAFINFWAYIAFSQYMLIWYANLPEETFWFLQRWEGGWMYISIALIIIHFVVPYFGLLSQPSKMNPKRLMFMSIWILFAHIIDLYWLIMPTYSKDSVPLGWIELAFPILAIGAVITVFSIKAKKENHVPIGDPKLKRGLDFRL
ncbi:MAG: quinol:cytochrome C oxidoreductase [Ignavibacteriae bacterium]|nr:quinol:cytochrome C oxidoreductase [Ignavibacteriota bacterium]